MNLEVLQPGEALVAGGTTVRFFIGVSADVDQHLVPNEVYIRLKCTCYVKFKIGSSCNIFLSKEPKTGILKLKRTCKMKFCRHCHFIRKY